MFPSMYIAEAIAQLLKKRIGAWFKFVVLGKMIASKKLIRKIDKGHRKVVLKEYALAEASSINFPGASSEYRKTSTKMLFISFNLSYSFYAL